MWLEKITLKDFRCFYDEQTIEFSQDPEKNVTLVHGESGLGKTTLLNALLWCFYGEMTARFEKREDLVNHDAVAHGRSNSYVEVFFEHNRNRYRARRYTKGGGDGREFIIMRIEQDGHQVTLPNPDAFINTVIPRGMAGHFLFDGEHAEVFLGEDNRSSVRSAVQDILGCSLIKTAIADLTDAAAYYRRQIPSTKGVGNIDAIRERIDTLENQIQQAKKSREDLRGDIEIIEQQIADIDDKLRTSAAAKELQTRRDKTAGELDRAKKREASAQEELLKWLGDNGRFLVSAQITSHTSEYLNEQEIKGKLPSPYNEEFVRDLLELERCFCGAELKPGSAGYEEVKSHLQHGANATLRSRIGKVRARLAQLALERDRAPGRLDAANKRLTDARQDISRLEADLLEISEQLSGINFDQIAEQETKRNQLRKTGNDKRGLVGQFDRNITDSESQKAEAERELRRVGQENEGARIFVSRYALCEALKARLERDLIAEEKSAKSVLRASVTRILDHTSRKVFRFQMSDDYSVSLVNSAGTQLAKTAGENQLLGLSFTAALVEFAKVRGNAEGHLLLRGTIAPLVLDSPFGQLDPTYQRTMAEYVPQMAGQVILMGTQTQIRPEVMKQLEDCIGEEYVLLRHNKDPRGGREQEIQQFNGKDVETSLFDEAFDGSSFLRVTR
jgi:DNA sulfur modification protein DndD